MSDVDVAKAKPKFKWRNFWICCAISMGQLGFAYPSAIIGVTLAQPAFLIAMGLITPDGNLVANANNLIGATSGVFQAGGLFGVLIGSFVMDKWGRKAGVIYCASLSIFGGTLICAAQDIGMFIAFRFFAGAGSWGFIALTPVYTTELAPPEIRGFFVGMNGVLISVGYAMASYMGLAFSYIQDSPDAQWRGPLGLALIFPVIMLIVIYFAPESPRWLLMKGRAEQAWQIVSNLHSDPNDPDQEFIRGEFYQMQKQAKMDITLDPSWKQLFTKHSYRKRAIIAIGFAFVGQSTAILVVNNYGPIIYKSLGFGTRDQLILQCGWVSTALPANVIAALILDKFGRRPLMLFSIFGCCICLSIEAAMVALYAEAGTNKAGLGAAVAAFYAFLVVYSFGVDVAGMVFYSELFPNHLRAKGVAVAIMCVALTDLIYLQVTAEAFAKIGWKFYLVFIIVMIIGGIWLYFMLPETKGVPLEELAALFGDDDEIVVYLKDIHVDHNTHQLVIDRQKGTEELGQVVTELHVAPKLTPQAQHIEKAPTPETNSL